MTNDKDSAVLKALEAMLEHYVQLAGCGDCGNWNPEEEPIVIATRKLLAQNHAASDALMRIASIKADDGDDYSGWDDDVVIRCEISVADLKAIRAALRQPTQSDALVEIIGEIDDGTWGETKAEYVERLRAALEARGLEIREKNDGQ